MPIWLQVVNVGAVAVLLFAAFRMARRVAALTDRVTGLEYRSRSRLDDLSDRLRAAKAYIDSRAGAETTPHVPADTIPAGVR